MRRISLKESIQGTTKFGEIFDKTVIIAAKSKKRAELCHSLGPWPGNNHLDLRRICCYSILRHSVSNIGDRSPAKLALVKG